MKFRLTLLAIIIGGISLFAQTPNKMSFQAVLRDGSGDLVTSASVTEE